MLFTSAFLDVGTNITSHIKDVLIKRDIVDYHLTIATLHMYLHLENQTFEEIVISKELQTTRGKPSLIPVCTLVVFRQSANPTYYQQGIKC